MSRTSDRRQTWTGGVFPGSIFMKVPQKAASLALLITLIGLCSCGGGSSNSASSTNATVSGNWQFNFAPPQDGSFSGGLQGGFLVQDKGSVSGQIVYSVTVSGSTPVACDGSAVVTGSLSGQSLTLNAVAGSQTFTLSGTLSADGSTLTGTYNTIATPNCGTAQSGLQWGARLMPALTGALQGYFHSTLGPPTDPVVNQDFQVTGSLMQGPNTGANSASVTGTLNFQGYPCLDTASVNGQISGSSVILQLIAPNGLNAGSIGAPPATSSFPATVAFQSVAGGGYILQGANGYGISTSACPAPATATSPGDVGNVCLALGSSTACKQVLSLTPAFLTFPAQMLGSAPTTQTVTITNIGSAALNNLQLSPTGSNFTPSDFDGLPNFSEMDNCSSTPGSTFSLTPQQSCKVTMQFSPQESCPWQPLSVGVGLFASPSQCPPFQPVRALQVSAPPALPASVTLTCASCSNFTDDPSPTFVIPVAGLGMSAIQPSTPELDFGAEDASLSEVSEPQSMTFTNQSNAPVQILPAMAAPPCGAPGSQATLPRPASPGSIPGLQVVQGSPSSFPPSLISGSQTITYACDLDRQSLKANFQIVSDDCSGSLLNAQQSCSLSMVYAPQPQEAAGGLEYFLQLNTLQCTSTTNTDCEINSGRFPVELTSGLASPLRLFPAAGLNFGTWPSGSTSYPPLTITLSNDKSVANPQPINFTAIVTTGDYSEIDNCGISLVPGGSCTMNITFAPKITGFDQGAITLTYSNGSTAGLSQVIALRGFGQ
jgi:hypothetical protein